MEVGTEASGQSRIGRSSVGAQVTIHGLGNAGIFVEN